MGVSFVLHHLVDCAWRYSVCPGIAKQLWNLPVIAPGQKRREVRPGGLAGKSASMAKRL